MRATVNDYDVWKCAEKTSEYSAYHNKNVLSTYRLTWLSQD